MPKLIMSNQEKLFIVVSPSHHKKPRTMFLNKTNSGKIIWCDFVPGITTLWLLSEAQEFAASSPVAIWFIEDKDWISTLETGDMPKFVAILNYARKAQCEIIRYLPQDQIPLIVAPSEQELADDALREIAAQLHDFTAICITSDKPIATLPDAERDDDKHYLYVLYTETADGQITYYRSEAPKNTIRIKKQVAEVFTKLQAQAKTVLPDEDGCIWQVGRIPQTMAKDTEIVMQKVQPNMAIIDDGKRDDAKVLAQPKEEQPAAKKRVAYALCDYIDGEPSYFCAEYAELYIKRGKENVQVFCTKEDAEFYNAIFMARHPNQSEMYVVEIEY
jgi:hypothetical protein